MQQNMYICKQRSLSVVQYQVDVQTGNKFGAGTDADVFCCLFGHKGDTGDRPLTKSSTHTNKFEKGKLDSFMIEAVSLGMLERIRIGHNGKSAGDGQK